MSEDQIEGSEVEFSLADLAGLDASEIAEVRSESLPGGVYDFEGVEAKLDEGANAQDEKRFFLTLRMKVVEVKAVVDRGVDKESLIGKIHQERQTIVPVKAAEGIGRVRAFFADIGLPNQGPIGGTEDMTGFVDGFVGHTFTGKIERKPRRGDPGTKDSRLKVEPAKK